MVAPAAACQNLQRLADAGCAGPLRLLRGDRLHAGAPAAGQTAALVRSFMAHHQGMSLLALDYALLRPADAAALRVRSAIPGHQPAAAGAHPEDRRRIPARCGIPRQPMPRVRQRDTPMRVFSRSGPRAPGRAAAVQRPLPRDAHQRRRRLQPVCASWRSRAGARTSRATTGACSATCATSTSGEFWSTRLPADVPQDRAVRGDLLRGARRVPRARARVRRAYRDRGVARRRHRAAPHPLTNRGRARAHHRADQLCRSGAGAAIGRRAASGFSNLFVQTELVPRTAGDRVHAPAARGRRERAVDVPPDGGARRRRRRRSPTKPTAPASSAAAAARPRRWRWIRCRCRCPAAQGSVLDPIVAIRCRITLEPEQTATSTSSPASPSSATAACALIDKYRDRHLADRVFDLAWTHSQVVLRQLNAGGRRAAVRAHRHRDRLSRTPTLRAEPACCAATGAASPACGAMRSRATCRSCCCRSPIPSRSSWCASWCRRTRTGGMKGLAVDLVIWNEDRAGYRQELQDQIMGLIALRQRGEPARSSGRHLRAAGAADFRRGPHVMQAVARIVAGRRSRQRWPSRSTRRADGNATMPRVRAHARRLDAPRSRRRCDRRAADAPATAQSAWRLRRRRPRIRDRRRQPARATPAPWVNVLANPHFGTVISESGSAYTWGENAHEFRLTPWHNDPVSDGSGEAFYLRDEETGRSGRRRRCRPRRGDATSRATASATACSSTPRTASTPSCGSTSRWTRR